jgi:hypothetical protein
MIETNRAIIASIVDTIDQFVAGELEIVDVQVKLETSVDLLERDSQDFVSAVSLAEADLEEIQSTLEAEDL